MIDSHAHIHREEFDADREAVLARAAAAGVRVIVEAATDAASARRVLQLARSHPGLLRAAVGFHPCDVRAEREAEMEELEALAREPEVVAIGETGLDAHWEENAPLGIQERFLRRHIALAKAVGKPLVLHHRKAGERALLERGGAAHPDPEAHSYYPAGQ